MSLLRTETPPFIDIAAPEIMISGFHVIHTLKHGLQRYICYADHFGQDGRPERRHSGDLIVAAADVPFLIQQSAASLVMMGVHLLVRPPALVH